MNSTVQLILIIAVLLLAVLLLILWFRVASQHPREEKKEPDDNLAISVNPTFQFTGIEISLANKINEAINKMGAMGNDAEVNYQASLKALLPESKQVVHAIGEELNVVGKARFLDRWSLIQLLAELQDPTSLPLLDGILSEKMPLEQFKDPHNRSSLRQETINLTTAVEAINRMAAKGNGHALELLLRHASHESLSVRRACVQGYATYAGEKAREKLLEILPKNDHYLLDIQRRNIEEMSPIQVKDSDIPSREEKPFSNDIPRVPPLRDQ